MRVIFENRIIIHMCKIKVSDTKQLFLIIINHNYVIIAMRMAIVILWEKISNLWDCINDSCNLVNGDFGAVFSNRLH